MNWSRLPAPRQFFYKLALAITLAGFLALGGAAGAGESAKALALPTVSLAELPVEAKTTEERVRRGGPFEYAKDGSTFGNRERLLPPNARGYYREYTVKTPGARDRGARRIVCGGRQPATPDACYYTGDHYASFSRIEH